MSSVLSLVLLCLMRTAPAQAAIPQRLDPRLLIVSARKIANHGPALNVTLQSGDHIDVPANDVNDHATEIVRAALRSQSPRLHLTPPERVVVLNVASLTNADNHGRLTVTLSSGATIHCRADDVRPDPHLVLLRTILIEDMAKAAASVSQPAAPATEHPFGPSFEFNARGVDFDSWLRRFKAQVNRNWLIPYAAMNLRGHVVLRFTVHKDGAITDLTIVQPSAVEAFTKGAFHALEASNPTVPLPQEYPDEKMEMTVVFYYNEEPAKSSAPR